MKTIRLLNATATLLILLCAGLLAWLSHIYVWEFDWTSNQRHTLSESSQQLLDNIDQPIVVTAFATENDSLRQEIQDFISPYQRYYSQLEFRFTNPDTAPDQVRELGISFDGELLIEYGQRQERLNLRTEEQLTNVLLRLSGDTDRWIVFIEGHGERRYDRQANHDLSAFTKELSNRGFKLRTLNLVQHVIPDNARAIVLAGPSTALLPGEVEQLISYVLHGGNLLWLSDPTPNESLQPLAASLNLQFLPGTIVDATSRLFGLTDPALALVTRYPSHPITDQFQLISLFPRSVALTELDEGTEWEITPFLQTAESSWTESSPIEGEVKHDADLGEINGPLNIGMALQRDVETDSSSQRIVVIGDGDFLSNSFLSNSGNLDLGLNIMHWLSEEDSNISIPARSVSDYNLQLSELQITAMAFWHLIGLPFMLLLIGFIVWRKRR